MSFCQFAFFCSFLIICIADQVFTATNSMLDPNRITWWRTKWASAPILLSINNRNQLSSLTFFVSPTTSIASGVFEVTFPTNFIPASFGSSQIVYGQVLQVLGQSFTGGQDYSVVINGLMNPETPGAYGPFAIRTRFNPSGQQVDVNLTFGSVYITGDAGTLQSLSVSFAGATTNPTVNQSGNTLSFQFTLGVSLWRYDTFIISTDSRWTIGSNLNCWSNDLSGHWNNFNGTDLSNPHVLDCVVTPQSASSPVTQYIYIYGLAVDGVDVTIPDNQNVDLRVSSVRTPGVVYTTPPYSWTVSTSRFGTNTILETNTYIFGLTITPGVISAVTWTPTWGLPTTSIAQGSSYFMDLTFAITNPIPSGGSAQITLTENVGTVSTALWTGTGTQNCYIVTYLGRAVTCIVTGTMITVGTLPGLVAGTVIKMRNIVTFSPSASTDSITTLQTFDPNGFLIDSNIAPLGTITLLTNSATISFGVQFQDAHGVEALAGGYGDQSQQVQFYITLGAVSGITTATSFGIYCPMTSVMDDFNIGIPPGATFLYLNDGSPGPSSSFGSTVVSNGVPILSTTGSQGSITFTGSIGTASPTVSYQPSFHLLVQFTSSSGTPAITLPRVANNLTTAYECRVMISLSINSENAIISAATRFLIKGQTWHSNAFSLPCSSYIDGVPGIFTLLPNAIGTPPSMSTGTAYYVEVQIKGTANFGSNSGVTTAVVNTPNYANSLSPDFTTAYPVALSSGAAIQGVTYTASVSGAVYNYVAVTGFAMAPYSALSTIPTTLAFPIGGIIAGSTIPAPTIRSYYILSADPRYKFITHESLSNTMTTVSMSATTTSGVSATVVGSGNVGINGVPTYAVLSLAIYGVPTTTTSFKSSYYLYFLLGQGFTWTSYSSNVTYLMGSSSSSFSNTFYFSSPTSAFGYPGVLLYVSNVSGSVVYDGFSTAASGTAATISLSGVNSPLGAGKTQITVGVGGAATGACAATITKTSSSSPTLSYISNPGTISSVTVSPTVDDTNGPDGVNISHTVSFILQHGLPVGSSINMTYNSHWTTPTTCASCSVLGLPNGPVTCSLSSHSVTVTSFAVFSTPNLKLYITVTGLLGTPFISSGAIYFVTSLTTNTGPSAASPVIDSAVDFSNTGVIVVRDTYPGDPVWYAKNVYPLIAGTTMADLYLQFSLPHTLPMCGIMTITSPLPFSYIKGPVNNHCFLSPLEYSSCVMTSNSLQITLSQVYVSGTVLELYLDNAVDIPLNTVAVMSMGFTVTTSWGGVVVDADTGAIEYSQSLLTAPALLTSNITSAGVRFDPTNTGEVATYTFEFNDTVGYSLGHQYWIVFPSQFDYFLGDVWVWFTTEPNSYYIECSSLQLVSTLCTIDHSIVVVQGTNTIVEGTTVVINVYDVVNPAVGHTDSFQIYHLDNNGNFLSVNQDFGSVNPTGFPENLDVRSLVQTENRLFHTSDYTWRLYVSDTMTTNSELQVLFPQEFDLELFDQQSSYGCVSTLVTDSASHTWNSASSCPASGNRVSLPAPTIATTFTSANIVTWTIHSVANNQWGQLRYAYNPTTDLDVQDYSIWPVIQYWVSKFTFFVYVSSTSLYTSRSYPNMNSAYTGFIDTFRPLYVNFYTPQSKTNRILVYAGTQTQDIWISTADSSQPMAAKQVTLKPITNSNTPDKGKLLYTSELDNWTLFQSNYRIRFRVAAAIDLMKGLYYINWVKNETKQTGFSQDQYDPPVSTLVEVVPANKNQFPFQVASIPSISIGSQSVPIIVSVSNAPHSYLQVGISVSGSPKNITILPNTLNFLPDINARFFQIAVNSNYDLGFGSVQTILFTLTGTDALVYSIVASQTLTIVNDTSTNGNILSWGLGLPSKTIETATPSCDQVGVVYFQLSAAGSTILSFERLKAEAGSMLGTLGNPSSSQETEPVPGEAWVDFQFRLYKTHLEQVWIGSIPVTNLTSVPTLTFDWLYADTTYELSGYLDNLNRSAEPTVYTENFTTAATADCQPFTVSFLGNVSNSYVSLIATEAAYVQGVNPMRLLNGSYSIGNRRMQSTNAFTYILLPNRYSEFPDPVDQAAITGAALTTFTVNLAASGITLQPTVLNDAIPVRKNPHWTVFPSSLGATSNTVTISFLADTIGQVCCSAMTESVVPRTPEQVMLGLDSKNQPVSCGCAQTNLTADYDSLIVDRLKASTSYYVFCTAMDDYPLWPSQMDWNQSMTPVVITTLEDINNTETKSISAGDIGGLVFVLALLVH